MLPRGYDFVSWLNDSDVIIAVNPDGSETTLFGSEQLVCKALDLRIARVPVECDDGEVARLAMRVMAIKGSCERDPSC
jgi:hypothetical protein